MAADGTLPGGVREPDGQWVSGADRAALLVFVNDGPTEVILRDGLSDAIPEPFEVVRGGIRAAITALQKTASPRNLIVDISREDEPLTALRELSQVVEPDVRVLVVGEINSVDFYREITRNMGAREYLPKPLTRDVIVRLFVPVIAGRQVGTPETTGGRVITVTGARGGVGASTIAVNLAWHFGVTRARHTVLLDPDLHTGTAALYLDALNGLGLRAALEMPDRIDDLFVERACQVLKDRLHVLAGQEPLSDRPICAPDAVPRLLAALRHRYNFIVADVPFHPVPLYRDLLELAGQRVIVFEPTLAGVRDALRLRALHDGQAQLAPTVMVLNRMGMPGSLTLKQVEDVLEARADVVIPDMPKRLAAAANMGEPAIRAGSHFRIRVEDLARLVAFNRLLDSAPTPGGAKRQAERKRAWQFWKKKS
jgi:pilus assembly protein CpaE